METINNHKVNFSNPGRYFLGNSAFNLFYDRHGGFLTSFIAAYISPLLPHADIHLNNKNAVQTCFCASGGISHDTKP